MIALLAQKSRYSRAEVSMVGFFGLLLLLVATAVIGMTPKGATIGNQAIAEYVDATGTLRTVTSNMVETKVLQVAGVQMTADVDLHGAPGQTLYFPVKVQNTGNGDDTYLLTATQADDDGFNCADDPRYFVDADADGVADDLGSPVTETELLGAGAFQYYVVSCVVPLTGVADEQRAVIDLLATSQFIPVDTETGLPDDDPEYVPPSDGVQDEAIIDDLAFTVVKSALPARVSPGAEVTYTFIYTNTGTQVTDIAIRDVLPLGVGYVAGSGNWDDGVGDFILTDSLEDEPNTSGRLEYRAVEETIDGDPRDVVTIEAFAVGPNESAEVNFKVTVNADQNAGFIVNQGSFDDGSGVGGVPGGGDGRNFGTTNEAPIEVINVQPAVVFTDPAAGEPNADDNPDNGVYEIEEAFPGYTLRFYNVLTNNGNAVDTFDITTSNVPGNEFPGGTSFTLLSEALVPMVDTNNTADVDTGPLNPGESYVVVLQVTLPATASGDGPFQRQKVARSSNDRSVTASMIDELGSIEPGSVDLTNNSALAAGACDDAADDCGFGPGPEAEPVTSVVLTPGQTAYFRLFVNNTKEGTEDPGVGADSYNLDVSTDSSFATVALPDGWDVRFHIDSNGIDDGNDGVIDVDLTGNFGPGGNTTSIEAGTAKLIWAEITTPDLGGGQTQPGVYNLYFRAQNPSLPAGAVVDIKHDAVELRTIRRLDITPNRNSQVIAGGCVVYFHTLTNRGSVTEGDNVNSTLSLEVIDGNEAAVPGAADADQFETSVLYWDRDNDRQFDAPGSATPDPVITNPVTFDDGLQAGEVVGLFLEVCALPGAAVGAEMVSTINVAVDNIATGSYEIDGIDEPLPDLVKDSTQVFSGERTVEKLQLVNPECTQAGIDAGTYNNMPVDVDPGQCICYLITMKNESTAPISGLTIEDATPAFTTYNACENSTGCPATGNDGAIMNVDAPPVGGTGPITAEIGVLGAEQQASLRFCVQVDQ